MTAEITIAVEDVTVRAEELPRSGTTYRNHFVAFSIQTNSSVKGDYRLAVRAKSQNEPIATEIRASKATIVRTLDETAINVFLSFHLGTDLFDDSTVWPDRQSPIPIATARLAMLQPASPYALYAVSESDMSDTTVHHLFDFTTDAEPADNTATGFHYNILPDSTFTIRKGEAFLYGVGVIRVKTAFAFVYGNQPLVSMTNASFDRIQISPGNNYQSLHFADGIGATIIKNIGLIISKTLFAQQTLNSGYTFTFRSVYLETEIRRSFVIQ
ncbi:MAG: hypothetical protein LC540_20015, partial [Candidatus Thiodiazotropha sp.]|nr:hypothetical protein [Candidatus Thiodiazotropha sp.]